MSSLGIVGTGTMGRTVAERLLPQGFTVYGYDTYAPCAERSASAGIAMCASLKELAEKVRQVILFLPGPVEIEQCVCGSGGLLETLQSGSIIIDMCTSAPDTTRGMDACAQKASIRYIDAPVLGRPATVGSWALPVGGSQEAMEECLPFMRHIAAHVIHMGPSGAGHTVKLLNQLMFGAINAMTAEMMAVSEKVGIPPAKLYEVITASQAGTVSNLFKELGKRVSEERYGEPTFTVDLLNKDVRLGVEMAENSGAPVTFGRTVDFLNRISQAQGYGSQDTSVMWKSIKNLWKQGELS